jgi:hypothetical protein
MTKRNTAKTVKNKSTTSTNEIQFTEELVNIGKMLFERIDTNLQSVDLKRSEIKESVVSIGQDVIDYLASYGTIETSDQAEHIKNTIYDQLNWKRNGLPSGGNKGRLPVNKTITKYWSIIFGYLSDSPKHILDEKTKFTDVRDAYQNRGNRQAIRSAKYEVSKIVNSFFEGAENLTKKDVTNIKKSLIKCLEDQKNIG